MKKRYRIKYHGYNLGILVDGRYKYEFDTDEQAIKLLEEANKKVPQEQKVFALSPHDQKRRPPVRAIKASEISIEIFYTEDNS